ncbi:MAG: YaaR family protein [Firmicutes bacterium]|nr:DUF327 family protein [Alicyclobacillaceae bacterium]MCL6497322.1 YaaR family protein [Bacillota bacterium]
MGSEAAAPPSWEALRVAELALLERPIQEEFARYQAEVRRLLDLGLRRRRVLRDTYRSPRGWFRILVAVEGIDQELEALREALLRGSRGMTLMERFDAIRGLLLDVWM